MSEKKYDTGTTKSSQDPSIFGVMCDSVYTSMVTLNNTLQEFFSFKDELLTHNLPPKLLVNLTLLSSKLFRSYSDLCTPVNELSRMVRLHSTPWEEKTEGLKKIRTDYENMQRRINIALKKIEMMSAEEERIKHERRLINWERLYSKVMEVKSHGRRWKFRIEPLKKKLERDGYNPYLSDSSEGSEDEDDEDDELRQLNSPFEGSEDGFRELDSNSDSVDGESFRESSRKSGSSQKRVHFMDGDEFDIGYGGQLVSPVEMPIAASPAVETSEASTSTQEPSYDNYLLLQVYRPKGLLPDKDACCSFSLGDQFCSSQPFPSKQEPGTLLMNQSFHFELSEDSARSLPPLCQDPLDSVSVPKLAVAVYPRSLAGDMAAHVTLPLKELTVTEEPTIIVPPQSTEEEFEIKWEEISSSVHAFPVEYPLNVNSSKVEEIVDEGEIPVVPIVCHKIKVQKHEQMHCGTDTAPWEELLLELGYHLVPDTQSQAVSAINFDLPVEEPPTEEDKEDSVTLTQEQMAEFTLKHAEEMKKLQSEYEKRLAALSKNLSRVKAEKARQIEELEKALIEAEQNKGRKGRSVAEIQSLLARKKKLKLTHGLPEWGKDLPQDFFERLELFADESIRKQEELTQRIKLEVSQACERQLATQHKLAPGFRTDIDTTTEDVSLPALFMPSSCTKNLVYTPRAHSYFHPPGSSDTRISQPPSVFKLPALHTNHLSTLNLFELSQQFSQSGPRWLKDDSHPSPHYTPAPPPSTSDSFHHYN